MATPQPSRTIQVGRYALAVGAPGGTLILPSAETGGGAPAELEQALEDRRTGGERAEQAVLSASDATRRVEEADDLLRAALAGSLLDPDALSRRADAMLGVLQRLDRDGRWEEWLRYARAMSGLLALAQRWAALVRSLRDVLRAAERIPELEAAVGWAEHELGTLHLAVEDAAGAERHLARAQEIRRRLGDHDGLAVTEQGMGVLCRQGVRAGRWPPADRRLVLAATALFLLLLGGVVGAAVDPFDGGTDPTLTVRVDGRGSVTTRPAAIRCPDRCEAELERDRPVTLTAAAGRGTTFAGWGGDCRGTRRCRLRMDAERTVTARFERAAQPRAVIVDVTGDGTVTSASGIDCPGACRTTVERGSRIRLVATPLGDAAFTGWRGGGCDGTDPCAITVDEPVRITAGFAPAPEGESTLTVIPEGDGSGSVTSRPRGIACGLDCSATFPRDTGVTLSHAADEGSVFAGWSGGGCTGAGECVVTLGDSQEVTARFDLAPAEDFTLTTSTSGPGSVTATSGFDDVGQSCGGGCVYPAGTVVTLGARPGEGANSVAWSGCEPASGDPFTCTVTMSSNRDVSATFSSVVE